VRLSHLAELSPMTTLPDRAGEDRTAGVDGEVDDLIVIEA
jgi:hypothetical protein